MKPPFNKKNNRWYGHIILGLLLFIMFFVVVPSNGFAFLYSQTPTADTLVSSQKPDKNYGTYTFLNVYSPTDYQNSYLKFDLSAIPDTATITKAELHLYASSTTGTPLDSMYHMADAWSELTLTWNIHDTFTVGSKLEDSKTTGLSWNTFDLLSGSGTPWDYVPDLTDNYLSLMLQSAKATGSHYISYYSDETSFVQYRPYLEIEYSTTPVFEPATMLLLGLGLMGLAGIRRKFKN